MNESNKQSTVSAICHLGQCGKSDQGLQASVHALIIYWDAVAAAVRLATASHNAPLSTYSVCQRDLQPILEIQIHPVQSMPHIKYCTHVTLKLYVHRVATSSSSSLYSNASRCITKDYFDFSTGGGA